MKKDEEIKLDDISVNNKGKSFASSLIAAGKINEGAWSFTAADGNKILGADGNDWVNYAKHHLAIDTSASEETKARYKFPFAKNGQIYRRGVIAAKSRAAQQGYDNIMSTADDLLQKIDAKLGKKEEDACVPAKKKKSDSVQRYDFIELLLPEEDNTDILTEPFVLTDEGYLRGRAIVTNIGVFPYLMPDGKVRWELRPAQEVLSKDSLDTLKMKPFTNEHPVINGGFVNTDNLKELQAGFLGDDIMYDSFYVSAPLTITDKQAIEDAKNGKRALSAGYTADIEKTSGVWLGVPYDAIQRNIRYNHVSLVDRGRAGDEAKIRFDFMDSSVAISEKIQTIYREDNDMNLKSVVLDGVDYKAEAEVIKALNQQKAKVAELENKMDKFESDATEAQKNIDTISAERDTLQDKVTNLEKEKADRIDEKVIDEAVKKRLAILKIAESADVELKGDETELDIQKAIIIKVFPNAQLEDKSQVYIDARFDGAKELLDEKKQEDSEATNRQVALDVTGGNPADLKNKIKDSFKVRADMIERLKKLSRGEKVEEVA